MKNLCVYFILFVGLSVFAQQSNIKAELDKNKIDASYDLGMSLGVLSLYYGYNLDPDNHDELIREMNRYLTILNINADKFIKQKSIDELKGIFTQLESIDPKLMQTTKISFALSSLTLVTPNGLTNDFGEKQMEALNGFKRIFIENAAYLGFETKEMDIFLDDFLKKKSFDKQTGIIIMKEKIEKTVYVDPNQDKKYSYKQTSDVDINIPDNKLTNDSRFAFIIGNEDYSSNQGDLSSEINVDFARNDASAFKEYALKTLGIPAHNIIFLLDATTGQMKQGISKLNLIIKNTQGKAEVFVYYAGHGLPDELTKEAYLIPVDVSGKNAADGIKLKDLYARLTEFPSKRVTVFIDACFSGGARNQGLLAARGVKVKPKQDLLDGDIVVFTASSGEQSSLPFKEKQHGFFTYYLLKKLQESKGDITYGELSKYISDNVSLQSVLINDKEQSPQVNVSLSIENDWSGFILK